MVDLVDRVPSSGVEWWRPQAPAATAPAAARRATAVFEGSPLAFRATVAFTVILIVSPQRLIPGAGSLRVALLVALLAVGAALVDLVTRRRPMTAPREVGIAAALATWAVVTVPLALWPGGSVALLVGTYGKTLAIFWLLTAVVTSAHRLRRMAVVLCALAVVPALSALANYAAGGGAGKRIIGFEAPLTENPNDLALFLNLIVPLTVALMVGTRRPIVRGLLAGVLLIDVMAIIVTFSRAGLVMLLVVALVSAGTAFGRRRVGGALGLAALLGVALMLAPSGYGDRVATILDKDADPTGSAQARWTDTVTATRLLVTNPVIGVGIGNSILAMNEARGRTWTEIHNVYLQYGVDLGIPGVALFVALVVGAIRAARSARRAARRGGMTRLAALAGGLEASLIGFAAGAVFYPVAYSFYFYYIAGLALAARTVAHRELRAMARRT